MLKTTLAAIVVAMSTSAASAADFVVGFGFTDFNGTGADDGATVSLEIHSEPFRRFGKIDLSYAGSLVGDENGDFYVGAGISALRDFENKWFWEASFMPGLFVEGPSENDLGSALEFRSLFGVGRRLSDDTRISLSISHKSNASTGDSNPGANTLLLRFRRSF